MGRRQGQTFVYCNNKDLKKQIHLSKNSYCWFLKPKYHQYDVIYDSKKQIQRSQKEKDKGLIYRVYEHKHIPFEHNKEAQQEARKSKPDNHRPGSKYVKLPKAINFRPFKHFKFIDNKLTEVGRSHWKGNLTNGEFSATHGRITDELGRLYISLVDRYSLKNNWKNYTYLDEMVANGIEQLLLVGLKYDESKSDNPFAYLTTCVTNRFTKTLNEEKRHQDIRDDLLEQHGLDPSIGRQIKNQDTELHQHSAKSYKEINQMKRKRRTE